MNGLDLAIGMENSLDYRGAQATLSGVCTINSSLGVGGDGILKITRLERGIAFVFPLQQLFQHARGEARMG